MLVHCYANRNFTVFFDFSHEGIVFLVFTIHIRIQLIEMHRTMYRKRKKICSNFAFPQPYNDLNFTKSIKSCCKMHINVIFCVKMFTISQNGTSKQRPRLDLGGFSYVKDRTINEKIYWRCIKYKSDHCHVRLHTCLELTRILKQPDEYTYKFDATENQIRLFSQKVADRALNIQETADIIVTTCYKSMCSLNCPE